MIGPYGSQVPRTPTLGSRSIGRVRLLLGARLRVLARHCSSADPLSRTIGTGRRTRRPYARPGGMPSWSHPPRLARPRPLDSLDESFGPYPLRSRHVARRVPLSTGEAPEPIRPSALDSLVCNYFYGASASCIRRDAVTPPSTRAKTLTRRRPHPPWAVVCADCERPRAR